MTRFSIAGMKGRLLGMGDSLMKRLVVSLPLMVAGGLCVVGASCRHQQLVLRPPVSGAQGIVTQESAVYFPEITAKNLNGDEVTLPNDLGGNPAIVLVAFKQKQQMNVNTWLFQLERIESMIEGVRVIETPTISSKRWGWMAGFIDGGMRSGIPDYEARARTITLFTDVGAFTDALEIESRDIIYAVILDRESRVLDVIAGDFDDEKLEEIAGMLN
ncbi:MAG: hypothetical protein AB8C13_06360 [Phycisphaerales bacterium]